MFPPRVLTRIFTWRAISSGCKKFRKLVQLCFSMINHFLCRVWCCDLFSKKYDFMMGDMENNPYKIAQVIFFLLNIVSLSDTRDVGQFFLNRWLESSRWSRRTIPISSTLDQSECKKNFTFQNSHFPFSLCLQTCYLQWKVPLQLVHHHIITGLTSPSSACAPLQSTNSSPTTDQDGKQSNILAKKSHWEIICQACQFQLKCQTITKKTMSTPTLFHAKWMWFSILIYQCRKI